MSTNKCSLEQEAVIMQKIGVEFEKLPKESQARVIKWLSSAVDRDGIPDQTVDPKINKVIDIIKFFESKAPKSNYEKIAVLGYHFELVQKKGNFKLDNITQLWDETKEVLPGRQVIINAWHNVRTKYQYITTCPGTKECRIAIRGQKLVDALPDAPKELRGLVRSRKNNKNRK